MKISLHSLLLAAALAALAPLGAAQAPGAARYAGVRVAASAYRGAGTYSHGPSRGYSHSRSPSALVWVPGRYETVSRQVWIPGCVERVWIEPVFELRYDSCGIAIRVQVCPGHWENVQRAGHYELRSVREWRPGHWAPRGCL